MFSIVNGPIHMQRHVLKSVHKICAKLPQDSRHEGNRQFCIMLQCIADDNYDQRKASQKQRSPLNGTQQSRQRKACTDCTVRGAVILHSYNLSHSDQQTRWVINWHFNTDSRRRVLRQVEFTEKCNRMKESEYSEAFSLITWCFCET